ncbi:hypothetical protein [Phycicoccus sp. Root101]|uniref:hypothetical protein n=1 Tax=Phycicoccus sp. Root101 TaxID=1736421 RepID=UPI0012FC6423|nr:hypothetical protein [Phycicoccus sp. Root101]
MRPTLAIVVAGLLLAACSSPPPGRAAGTGSAASSGAATATSPGTTATTAARSTTSTTAATTTAATKRPSTATATKTARSTPSTPEAPTPTPSRSTAGGPARPAGLVGDTRNALAFAPLSDPGDVTVEGSVPSWKAWSTSKVLVVAAFLDTVCDGDPGRATAQQRRWISAALTASDADAVVALRNEIPGSPGAAITRVLRSVGDTRTVAPDTSQGGMQWTIREQVRFMAALANGRVVSRASSSYLLSSMRPISAHRWGLGTIGAGAFKGGWLRPDTVTRQMGIYDGYAVAIITDHVGPAVVQTDGDSAHVQQMNRLATILKARLARE